jgi:hypothetical protein
MEPEHMIGTTYFKSLKPETVTELVKEYVRNRSAEGNDLREVLWEWAQEECLRKGKPPTVFKSLWDVIPGTVKDTTDENALSIYFGEKLQPRRVIFARKPDGSSHGFDMSPTELVSTMKAQITEILKIQLPRIIYRGRILEDDRRLEEYGVRIGDTVLICPTYPADAPPRIVSLASL